MVPHNGRESPNSFNIYSQPIFYENSLPSNDAPNYFQFDSLRKEPDIFASKEEVTSTIPFIPNQWLSSKYYEPSTPNTFTPIENTISAIIPFEPENQFFCGWNDCQLSFSTKTGLATHVSSHIFQLVDGVPLDSRKRTKTTVKCQWRGCVDSQTDWVTYKMLARHLSSDSHVGQMPFLPKVEGNSVEEEQEESDQKRIRGMNIKKPKKYICSHPGCGRIFTDSSNRKKHEHTHDVNRVRFYCTHQGCSKSYSTKTDLNIHMKVHTGDLPHKCTHPNCPKQFSRLSEKYAHERTHDNILPHVCEECGKRFREKVRLKKHILVHEKNGIDSP